MKKRKTKRKKNSSRLPSITKKSRTKFNTFISTSAEREHSTKNTAESHSKASIKLKKGNYNKFVESSKKIKKKPDRPDMSLSLKPMHKRAVSQTQAVQITLDPSKTTKLMRKASSKPVFDHKQQKKQDGVKRGLTLMKFVSKLKSNQAKAARSRLQNGQLNEQDSKNQIQRFKFKEIFAKVDKKKLLGECSYCFRKKCFRLVNTCSHGSCYTCTQFLLNFNKHTGHNEMRCLYCPEKTKNEQMTEDRKITREYLHYCYDNHGPDYTAEAPVTQNKLEVVLRLNHSGYKRCFTKPSQPCNRILCPPCCQEEPLLYCLKHAFVLQMT
ncbi:unnamed protein product [Moneuplotes crassus]|uniref:Uncharacterized protein n=1 Tax=Euplotes crassus TaxID=5936 RepID=A0AAD1Y295_EUPCR|nr:unnamed protein product [Moneuplotes crassus]